MVLLLLLLPQYWNGKDRYATRIQIIRMIEVILILNVYSIYVAIAGITITSVNRNSSSSNHGTISTIAKPNLEEIQRQILKSKVHVDELTHAADQRYANKLSIDSLKRGRFLSFTKQHTVMIFALDTLKYERFGNHFGQYLEAVACANLIGAHFVGVGKKFSTKLFGGLPTIIYHNNPKDRIVALSRLGICNKQDFPWTSYHAAWPADIDAVNRTLTPFIFYYIRQAYGKQVDLSKISNIRKVKVQLDDLFDLSNTYFTKEERSLVEPRNVTRFFTETKQREAIFQKYNRRKSGPNELTFLSTSQRSVLVPLIPNAAISFRCNDILDFDEGLPIYGFLNFNFYIQSIPKNVETIYILTEPLSYSPAGENHNMQACKDMIITLVLFLTAYYPSTVNIAVIRGHQHSALAIIQYAEIVVCTASTFCFWPGLNNRDRVYFPLSGLIAGGKPYYLTDSFNWISIPALRRYNYNSKNDDQKRTKLMKVFENLMIIPDPPECQRTVRQAGVNYKGKTYC